MSRTPGPGWTEINNALALDPGFVCLKGDVKGAFLLWALRYQDGPLPPPDQLGVAMGATKAKAFETLVLLHRAGFVGQTPNGKFQLATGSVRPHKTSAARMAKSRSKAQEVNGHAVESNVTLPVTPIVTSHRASQSDDCNVASDAIVTSQKEIPLRNPLRKTPNPEEGFGVSARSRAPHPQETNDLQRVLWSEIGSVPEDWLRIAAQQRAVHGLEPVDMALAAADFHDTYVHQPVNRKTRGEWQGQFNKFVRRQFVGKPNGTHRRSAVSDALQSLVNIVSGEASLDGDFAPVVN